jgi:hypothetical protein
MTLEVFRSGKAKIMGNGFGGHSDCARKVNRAGLSELYTAYPSKALRALEEKNPRRRGWFEDVHFGIFISFHRANPDTVDFLTKPASMGGLLDWSCAMPERPSPAFTPDDEPRASNVTQVGHRLHRRAERISVEEADGSLGNQSVVVLMRIGK